MPTACKPWRRRPTKLPSCLSDFCRMLWRLEWNRPGPTSFLMCWRRQLRQAAQPEAIRLRGIRALTRQLSQHRHSPPASAVRFQARSRHRLRPLVRRRAEAVADLQVGAEAVEGEAVGKKCKTEAGRYRLRSACVIAYTRPP